jgi:hypothetical protein
MTLRVNSQAPDFTAETTQGVIRFNDWIGNGWAILFSHPKGFTPVYTTEPGYMAGLKPEFESSQTVPADSPTAAPETAAVNRATTPSGRGRSRHFEHDRSARPGGMTLQWGMKARSSRSG